MFSVPFLLGAFLLPFPYNLPFILLLLGLAGDLVQRRLPVARAIAMGMLVSGFSMLPQALITPLYTIFAARNHEADFLTPLVHLILKVVGFPIALSQKTLFISTPSEVFSVDTTWEKLGLYFSLVFFIAGMVLIPLSSAGRRIRSAIFLTLAILTYVILRYVFMIAILVDAGNPDIFWKPVWLLVSFLPLAVLLMRFLPLEPKNIRLQSFKPQGKQLVLSVLCFLFVFSMVGILTFHDPGKPKQGRILIDEFHSNWEWTTMRYDTEWYGTQSGYNYYCLADYLNHFYAVDSRFETLTLELLSSYDVLIAKMPTTPYSREEIDAIEKFVLKGGGLFLIGDHTNVFGSSIYLNPLADRFGLKFNHDSTHDLITNDLTLYEPPVLLPHPVVQRIPFFLFATSCTLDAPIFSEGVITGYNLKALDLDYSRPNFFADPKAEKNYRFGLFIQAAAVRHGEGRVLAFTDSTVFSNFYMFMPGKPELAIGAIDWLNRENGVDYPMIAFIVVAVSSLVAGAYLISRVSREHLLWVLLFPTVIGVVLGVRAFSFINQTLYSPPSPHTSFVRVSFETEHSEFLVPAKQFFLTPSEDYHTFYVWTQRLGYVPSLYPELTQALSQGDVVILINPSRSFSSQHIDELVRYVEDGGKILLMEDSYTELSPVNSPANQILERFGMKINYQGRNNTKIYNMREELLGTIGYSAAVEGGEPLLVFEDGSALFSVARKGEGMLAVMASSTSFNNLALGETGTIPNEQRRFLYELEFWILESLVKDEFPPFDKERYNLEKGN